MTATAATAPATTAMVPMPTPAMVPVLSPTTAPVDWPPAAVAGCSVFAGAFGAADLFASCAHAMFAAARKTTAHIVFDLFTGSSSYCLVQHSARISFNQSAAFIRLSHRRGRSPRAPQFPGPPPASLPPPPSTNRLYLP